MTALYNLEHVHSTLAPALVGLEVGDKAWVESPFPSGKPVVELVGDRASGKTRLLTTLRDEYRDLVPTVYADLGEDPYSAADAAGRERLETPYSSPVTNILYALTHRLDGQKLRKNGKDGQTLKLRRVSTALYVVSAWRRSEDTEGGTTAPDQLIQAETELRDKLHQLKEREVKESDELVRAALDSWLAAVNALLGGLVPVPGVAEVLTAAQKSLRAWSSGQGGDDHSWWGDRLPGLDPPIRKLFDLAQRFRAPGPQRKEAEQHLIAALLADVNASYGWWQRKTRNSPLLLLDNIDDALRERWLLPFTEQFAEPQQGHRQGRVMSPAVLTTSLGRGSGPSLTPATHPSPWTQQRLVPPQSWLLRLGIPPVTPDEIADMLRAGGYDTTADRTAQDVTDQLTTVISRLSGGRTGNALLLAGAAAEWLRDGEPAEDLPDRLLGLPVPGSEADDPPTVAEQLLTDLLPDPSVRDQALRVAAALDETAAAQALRPTPPPDEAAIPLDPRTVSEQTDGNTATAIERLTALTLRRDHWHHAPWRRELGGGPLITDRALRAVLLHRLRTGTGGESWDAIHRRLLARYATAIDDLRPGHGLSISQQAFRLHHALARRELDTTVMPAVHRLYAHRPPAQVLREINVIAAAPEGPVVPAAENSAAGATQPFGAVAPCPECTDDRARQVHSSLRTLLLCVRQLSSPLAATPVRRRPEIRLLGAQLNTLASDFSAAPEHARAVNAYAHAVDGWENAFVRGVQAPDLPVHDGGR